MKKSTAILLALVCVFGLYVAFSQAVDLFTKNNGEIKTPEYSYICKSGGITLIAGTGTDLVITSGRLRITDTDTGNFRYLTADCIIDKI